MRHTRRSLGYVFLIITIVVAPSVMMLSWYQYSKDPNLRPLGITREALRAFGVPGLGTDMVAYIDWPAASMNHPARRQLASDLRISFRSKGVEPTLVFRDTKGTPKVTYRVGKSVIGPYSAARAAEGISAAVDAYRMH